MAQSKSSKLNIVALADLHIGSPALPPDKLLRDIRTYLYPKLVGADLLCICGDFFDTLLTFNSEAGICAATVIEELIALAVEYEFYIRVLKGTFSHDRFQNRMFLVKDGGNLMLHDLPLVRVIEFIDLEFITPLGITVLYCPDDQPHDDITDALVRTVETNKITSVDFLCSHGYLSHLLPAGIPHIPHNTIDVAKIRPHVSGYILNGHVHAPSVVGRSLSIGSFDRMEHGDETNKGFFLLQYDKNKHSATYEYVVNKAATPFITLAVPDDEEGRMLVRDQVTAVITNHRNIYGQTARLHIRLFGQYVSDLVSWIYSTYTNVLVVDKKTVKPLPVDNLDVSCGDLPIVTVANLATMIKDNLPNDLTLTLEEIQEILDGCAR